MLSFAYKKREFDEFRTIQICDNCSRNIDTWLLWKAAICTVVLKMLTTNLSKSLCLECSTFAIF